MKAWSAIGLLATLLLGSACDRAEQTRAPGAPAAAAAASPLTFARDTPDARARLTLPAALSAYPALHGELYRGETRQLTGFLRAAAEDRGLELRAGLQPPPHFHEIVWSVAAETPRHLSLVREEVLYTGGSHPNMGLRALLIDRANQSEVQPAALFRPDADFDGLDRLLCNAVLAARRDRAAGAPLDAQAFDCPAWRSSAFALAPSTTPGKLGGLIFLFAPYEVGAYSEGPYDVVIPQASFAASLSPAVADEFSGSPRPTPPRPRPTPPLFAPAELADAAEPGVAVAQAAAPADAE